MTDETLQPMRVLLGGGIGAGKSTVASVFVDCGWVSISADEVGATVLSEGSEAVDEVAAEWPHVVKAGMVDRAALAAIAFGSTAELDRLEQITHPRIAGEIERLISESSGDVVVEMPVLHLSPAGEWVRVAVVADRRERIDRAVARGGDRDDIERRIALQPTESEWRMWADHVIDTNGSLDDTRRVAGALISGLRA